VRTVLMVARSSSEWKGEVRFEDVSMLVGEDCNAGAVGISVRVCFKIIRFNWLG